MSRRLLAVGSAIGLLLPLAACGGDDPDTKPSPTKSASASSSPSESPTASTAPSLPADAEENTKAGAIAFVKHYVDLVNHLQFKGDATPLRQASAKSCVKCKGVADGLVGLYANGGHVEGGAWVVTNARADTGPRKSWLVLIGVNSSAQVVTKGDGTSQELPPGKTSQEFQVERKGATWEVVRWARVG